MDVDNVYMHAQRNNETALLRPSKVRATLYGDQGQVLWRHRSRLACLADRWLARSEEEETKKEKNRERGSCLFKLAILMPGADWPDL